MTSSSLTFGQQVLQESQKLQAEGKDPNQIANILCQKDKEGQNYGIGILLDEKGQPAETSKTLLKFAQEELSQASQGTYFNSAKILPQFKEEVLRWQKIPEKYWDEILVAIPSDAGTGAVISGVQFAQLTDPSLSLLQVEKMGWPAYRAIAGVSGLKFQEYEEDILPNADGGLKLYQAGPMNSSGSIAPDETLVRRAEEAGTSGRFTLLDRAYSGFEFSSQVDDLGLEGVMARSYEKYLQPFFESNAFFGLAISPTKAFVTFSLRPCGILLVRVPQKEVRPEAALNLNALIRARGSSFEHPLTRAFVKALARSRSTLESEQANALRRLKEAEGLWKKLTKGSPLEKYFSESYGGLFRNVPIKEGSPSQIYDKRLYPVFSGSRCRLNITGLPSNEKDAARHAQAFADICL